VSADDSLRPTASAVPLRATSTWPAHHQSAPLGKASSAGAAPAGASPKLGPAPSAPAAVSLKRGRSSASEQFRDAIEALRAKRVHVMALQGQVADAAQPLEALFEQAGAGDVEADAAAAKEAGPGPHQVVLPEPTADDDDEDSRNLHAALMLSLMGEDA
jgi:hypothetical protein